MAGFTGVAAAAASLLPGWALPAQAAGSSFSPAGSSFSPLRPPATPLAVRSMYLTTWLRGDNLAGTWPSFWAGQVTAITGIVRIDGTAYVFAGAPGSPSLPLLSQASLTYTATQSTYTFTGGGINLTVNFISPVDPESLQRQSVPMSYITVAATSADGGSHTVSVYLDISGEWAHGDRSQQINWAQQTVGGQIALSFVPTSPGVLAENSDQASWGTVVLATDSGTGVTWQIAQDSVARAAGATGTLPNTAEAGPRAINDRWPVFAVNRNLGTVSGTAPSPTMVVSLGHARTPAVSYLGTGLDPWWRTYWADWQSMLTWFRADYDTALAQSRNLDARIADDATLFYGANSTTAQQYTAICSLALRQAFGGTELVNNGGTPWAFLKEISSNGNMSTVDVLYPASPAYLYLSPTYLRLLLEPPLAYVEQGHWPQPYAEHDLGSSYPNATGHNDGGGENMPVEESANMLIMSAAVLARLAGGEASTFVAKHYTTLRGWAEYLVANALDPQNQNQTDDFTGPIAHSSNLALKGIIGIGAMGLIAQAAGNTADQSRYLSTAQSYITQWVTNSQDSGNQHLKLAYDQPGTWSLKYNGYPDKLLNLGLVPDAVASEEAAWYASQAGTYGIELDPRHTYTKVDWELWTAAFLANHAGTRDLIVSKVYGWLNATGSRVPFTDWYDVPSGNQAGFADRPVVGGMFSLLTLRHTPRGLTGWWPLDEGGGNSGGDASGNGHPLTISGSTGWTAGHSGRSLSLSGGFATTGRQVIRTDRSFSVAAWVNLASTAGYATAVSQDGVQASGFFLQYSQADNRWAFARTTADVANATPVRALSTAAPSVNTWTHLVGVYDADAGQLRLYVNGVGQSSSGYTGGWLATGNLAVGRGKWNGGPADHFTGAVDEVASYAYALSDAQAASVFHGTDNLVAAWPFDEGTGASAADPVGGHTATLTNAAWVTGFAGAALSANGSSTVADAGGALLTTTASFTVTAWVNMDNSNGFHTVVSQDGTQASGFYLQYSAADNRWAFARVASDAADAASTRALSATAPVVGQWTHLAGVYDAAAGQLRVYVNGVLSGTAAYTGAWNATGHTVIGRGRWNGAATDHFPGAIDQVRVYSRALSDSDIGVLV
jgi:hypothetical protein